MSKGELCPEASVHDPASHVAVCPTVHCPALHVPVPHDVHPPPWFPHAVDVVPATHCPAEQQPLHDVPSHLQLPDTQ
jgi:hypothetical protein